jgi:hypothetical protein
MKYAYPIVFISSRVVVLNLIWDFVSDTIFKLSGNLEADEEGRTSCANFLKGKYLEEYMVLNMKMGNGKSRRNRELQELNKGENVKWIKGQKISWLGHLERMEEDRMPKKVFTQELEGTG